MFRGSFWRYTFNLISLCVLLAGVGVSAYLDKYNNRGVDYNSTARIPYTDVDPLGANLFLDKEGNDANMENTFRLLHEGGFRYARQQLNWIQIEPFKKGEYIDTTDKTLSSWKHWDRVVQLANQYGVQLIFRLERPPGWSRSKSISNPPPGRTSEQVAVDMGPPDNLGDFGDFVATVVEHFRGRVHYYQIWNEPNLTSNWNDQQVDPAQYTALLKKAYSRAKEVDPSVVILSSTLAPTDTQFGNIADGEFTRGMYKAGAKDYFDIMAAQIYGFGYPPDDRHVGDKTYNMSRVLVVRKAMEENGDDLKPVWVSEYAWISIPPELKDIATPWGASVSEDTQAKYLVGGYQRARDEWPWMGAMCIWHFRWVPTPEDSPKDPTPWFAIINKDFSPRPAYTALKEYAATLTSASIGFHQPNSHYITYIGDWQAERNTAPTGKPPQIEKIPFDPQKMDSLDPSVLSIFTTKTGNKASFDFTGSRLSLSVPKGPQGGKLNVTIDDKPTFTIDEYAATSSEEKIDLSDQLPFNRHTVLLETSLEEGQTVGLNGFYVLRDLPVNYALTILEFLSTFGLLFIVWRLQPQLNAGIAYFIPLPWLAPGRRKNLLHDLTFASIGKAALRYLREGYLGNLFLLGGGLFLFYGSERSIFALAGALLFLIMTILRPELGIMFVVPTSTLWYSFYCNQQNLFWQSQYHCLKLNYSPLTLKNDIRPYEFVLYAVLSALVLHEGRHIWRIWRHGVDQRNHPRTIISYLRARVSRRFGITSFTLPVIVFLVAATVGLPFVADQSHLHDSLHEYRTIIVEPIIFWLAVTYFARNRRRLLQLTDGVIIGGVVFATVGLILALRGSQRIEVDGVNRIISLYGHFDNLGLLLGRLVPLTAVMALFLPPSRRRILYGFALLPLVITLFFSYSRGAWLGVFVAFVVVALVAKKRKLLFGLGGIALVSLAALPFIKIQRIQDLLSRTTGSNASRLDLWTSAFHMVRDYPFMGVGLDQFLYLYKAKYASGQARAVDEIWQSHPHNLILDYWLRLGIIGLIAAFWILASYFRHGVRLARTMPDRIDRAIALAYVASMVDFVVHGLFDNSYFLIDMAMIFFLSLGVLEILRRGGINYIEDGGHLKLGAEVNEDLEELKVQEAVL